MDIKKLKNNFLLGAATAAHQVEGNNCNCDTWVEENLEHSMYDEPSLEAVDHYNRYEDDIKMLAGAGLNAYRFSIEWARIQPQKDVWDENEILHYKKVLECCRKYEVEPVVTLFHFTSPKWLISMGGWENPQVVELFAAYCRKVTEELGDLMKYVCTMNEANMRLQIADILKQLGKDCKTEEKSKDNVQVGINLEKSRFELSQIESSKAFGLKENEIAQTFVSPCTDEGDLLVMKAHEAARDAIKSVCSDLIVGVTLTVHDVQNMEGAKDFNEKEWEREFMHYLPYIQDDDFLGVQCYTRKIYGTDGKVHVPKNAHLTQMGYEEYPEAIGHAVRRIAKSFKGDLIVTENGIATDDDSCRINFIQKATDSIKECINEGLPVKGYMYWSLFDNFEWQKGYSMKFGLIAVDRKTQKRYPKKSLYELGKMIAGREKNENER